MEKLNKFPMKDFYCRSGSVLSAFGVLLCVFCFVMLGWTLSWISFKCFFFFFQVQMFNTSACAWIEFIVKFDIVSKILLCINVEISEYDFIIHHFSIYFYN